MQPSLNGKLVAGHGAVTAAVEQQIMQGKPRVCLSQEEVQLFSTTLQLHHLQESINLQDSTKKLILAASCPTFDKCTPNVSAATTKDFSSISTINYLTPPPDGNGGRCALSLQAHVHDLPWCSCVLQLWCVCVFGQLQLILLLTNEYCLLYR